MIGTTEMMAHTPGIGGIGIFCNALCATVGSLTCVMHEASCRTRHGAF